MSWLWNTQPLLNVRYCELENLLLPTEMLILGMHHCILFSLRLVCVHSVIGSHWAGRRGCEAVEVVLLCFLAQAACDPWWWGHLYQSSQQKLKLKAACIIPLATDTWENVNSEIYSLNTVNSACTMPPPKLFQHLNSANRLFPSVTNEWSSYTHSTKAERVFSATIMRNYSIEQCNGLHTRAMTMNLWGEELEDWKPTPFVKSEFKQLLFGCRYKGPAKLMKASRENQLAVSNLQ